MNPRNPHPTPLPIPLILLPKEGNQELLLPYHKSISTHPQNQKQEKEVGLTPNPPTKKPPQDNRIRYKTHPIPKNQLGPQPPPKEPKVTRMSQHTIHTPGDKHMPFPSGNLHRMIKVTARLRHGHAADRLAHDHQQ